MTGWDYDENARTWRPPPGVQPHPHGGQELYGVWDPGDVKATARATAPPGWLLCDGAVVRRDTYPALFSAIGTTYNLPTGETATSAEFRLPNLKGRVIVMRDAAQVEFDVLGESGGSKNIVVGAVPGHTHGYAHTHGMNTVDTNHAHNVYTRNQDTGTVSSWHTHNYDHWHSASIGNVHWNGTQTHGHHGRGGIASEAPWEGANWAGAVPVNVTGTGGGGTGNPSANHVHNFNHDHPSTNWQNESPWPGTWSHAHTTNTQSASTTDAGTGGGSAAGNMPPYLVMNYLIKT